MYSNILNNWFYGEDVQVDDMKLLTKSFLQLCFAANGGNVMATGLTPTITGNNIATTKGFVYFGETSDAIFIERTGTNQLISFVDPTSVPLIANGYLYVKPSITYDTNNRTSTVSGIVYTSTSATAEGINLATITNSVITQVNSINPLGATQLQRGITQLATQAEVNAGTVTNKAVAPSTFAASTQLAAKAPLASPALTGTPTVPTAAIGTNTTQAASTAFVIANTMSLNGYIIAGTNLDTVTTSGVYIQASNANATLALNYPVAYAGELEVYTEGSFTFQRYSTYGLTNKVYTRGYYTTWGSWSELATLSDVTANGGGIVASGSNANGNWVKYANGLIQQWGVTSTSPPSSYAYVNFPIVFSNANYNLVAMYLGIVPGIGVYSSLTFRTAGQSVLFCYDTSNKADITNGSPAFYWTAEGY